MKKYTVKYRKPTKKTAIAIIFAPNEDAMFRHFEYKYSNATLIDYREESL